MLIMVAINKHNRQRGFSMMEVLITMIIILVGLLGIVALQAKATQAEQESYQRTQALIMLSDIVNRMNVNRATVSCFAFTTNTTNGTPFIGAAGTGHLGTPSCSASTATYNTMANNSINELDNLLKGTAERLDIGGTTENAGSMLGARACISYDAATELGSPVIPGTGLYTVIVSWQAMADMITPTLNCANGLYGAETKRRAVSTSLRLAELY
jgi:type IV pilus assembly protein PilV